MPLLIDYYCSQSQGLSSKYLKPNLATKAALNTNAVEAEIRIPDITNLATNVALNRKASKIKNKTRDFTDMATKGAINTKTVKIETNT